MPVVAGIADPSTDGCSTGFGILFHGPFSGPATQTSPNAFLTPTRANLAPTEAPAPTKNRSVTQRPAPKPVRNTGMGCRGRRGR